MPEANTRLGVFQAAERLLKRLRSRIAVPAVAPVRTRRALGHIMLAGNGGGTHPARWAALGARVD